MKEDAPFFVDYADCGWAVIQNFTKLALLLDDLCFVLHERADVIDPQHAFAASKTDLSTLIRHLHIRQEHMQRSPAFGSPNHPFIDQLAAFSAQRLDDSSALFDVVPEQPGVN